MAILSLKRWEREPYEAGPGVTIHMKLKRLKRAEAKPLAKVLIAVFSEFEKARGDTLTPTQKAAIMTQAYEVIPEDQLKAFFSSCVKDVEDLEIDGELVTTGPALLEEADDALLFWLLMKLFDKSKLTRAEGNASASRSTSLRLVTGEGGVSPAPPIEREAGTEPSTATEIPPGPQSSIAQE
jgi:hypothetical protein